MEIRDTLSPRTRRPSRPQLHSGPGREWQSASRACRPAQDKRRVPGGGATVVYRPRARHALRISSRATATRARLMPRRSAISNPHSSRWSAVSAGRALRSTIRTTNVASSRPNLLMRPLRSVSTDWYLRGVSPRWGATVADWLNRFGTSMVVRKASATIVPTPEAVISYYRQTGSRRAEAKTI